MKYDTISHYAGGAIAILLATMIPSQANPFGLGIAADFAILGINTSPQQNNDPNVSLSSGPLLVNGNVGVGNNGQFNFSSGTVNGNLYYGSGTSVSITGGTTYLNGTQNQINFNAINTGVANAVSFASSLTPTLTYNEITTSGTTINATGSQTVVAVTDNNGVHLSGGTLTLNGTASDTFIFQISGGFELSGNTDIVLTGGLLAQNVLWYFSGGNHVQTSGNSDTVGIFLAPNEAIQINGGVHDSEFISGVTLSFQSNPEVNALPFSAPDAGSTVLYMALALASLVCVKQTFLKTQ